MPSKNENIQYLKGMLAKVGIANMVEQANEINKCGGIRNCGACAVQYTEIHFYDLTLPVIKDRQFDINKIASLWGIKPKMIRFPALINQIKKDQAPCIICFWSKGGLGANIGGTHIINAIPDESKDGVCFVDPQKGETYTISKMQYTLMNDNKPSVLCVWTPDSYTP